MERKVRNMTSMAELLLLTVLCTAVAQGQVGYGQQIAVLKMVKPDLEAIGVLSTTMTEKDIANMVRTSLQQGVKVFVAQPKDPRDIPVLYKKLVTEKKVQLILIPSSDDKMLLGIGYEYLRENSLLDNVGVCVPENRFLASGAFFAVVKENGKLVVHVNQRIASLLGASIPVQENPSITFVAQ